MSKIQCTIVTPEKAIFEETVDQVTVPAHDGEVGIQPGHARFLARLGAGELRAKIGDRTERLFVDGGFVQVAEDRVTVLTDTACPVQDVDTKEIEKLVESLRGKGRGEELASANSRLLARKRVMERFARS